MVQAFRPDASTWYCHASKLHRQKEYLPLFSWIFPCRLSKSQFDGGCCFGAYRTFLLLPGNQREEGLKCLATEQRDIFNFLSLAWMVTSSIQL